MTLDIEKLFKNIIEKQSRINHFDCKIKVINTEKIPLVIKNLITNQYGQKYLDDSAYICFFWGNITKDNIKSLFKVVDTALGNSANKLTETDFKIINMNNEEDTSNEDTSDEDTSSNEDTSDEDTSSNEDTSDEDTSSNEDTSDEDQDLDKEIDDVINEDEKSKSENSTESTVNNKFFLKITPK